MDLAPLLALADQAYDQCLQSPPHPDCGRGSHTPDIAACSECLRLSYFDGVRGAVSYDCPRRRWVYVVRYLPTNAYDCYRVLSSNSEWAEAVLTQAGAEGELRIVSFGCGPGSDLIGAAMWLADLGASHPLCSHHQPLPAAVRLIGLDCQPGWEPLLRHVATTAGRGYTRHTYPLRVTCEMHAAAAPATAMREFRPHILLCSWIWSELESDEEATAAWRGMSEVLARFSTPCLVAVMDRTEQRMVHRIESLLSHTCGSYRVLESVDDGSYRLPISFSPRVQDLAPRKNMKSAMRLLLVNDS